MINEYKLGLKEILKNTLVNMDEIYFKLRRKIYILKKIDFLKCIRKF